ncbi:MAG: hypothetical protein ACREQX_09460 [Candidatus Binataceae bacterium]
MASIDPAALWADNPEQQTAQLTTTSVEVGPDTTVRQCPAPETIFPDKAMGLSIGNVNSIITNGPGKGKCASGTAGAMVYDNGTLALGVLSDAHVLAGVDGIGAGVYGLGSGITMPGPADLPMPTGQTNQYGGHYCNPTLEQQNTVASLTYSYPIILGSG